MSSCNGLQDPKPGGPRFLAVAALVVPAIASGGQFYDEPSVTVSLGFDDNVRFEEKDEDSSFQQTVSATAGYGYRTEISDIKFHLKASLDRYSEEPDLNTDDQSLGMNGRYRMGLNLFQINGNLTRDTSRTSELETTGQVRKSKRRHSWSINPAWIRTINERTSLQLGYRYNKVIYDDSDLTGLYDYRDKSVNAGLFYLLGERTQVSLNGAIRRYRVSATDSETEGWNLTAGLSRSFSETLQVDFSIGGRRTDSKAPRNLQGDREQDSNYGLLYQANISKQLFPTTSVTLSASRDLQPSGSGRVVEVRRVGLNLGHEFSERWSGSVASTVFRNETENDNDVFQDEQRTYFTIEPKLLWRLTPWWRLSGSYRYRYQEYDGEDRNAVSNAVFIDVSYQWPRESPKSSEL